MDNIFQLPFPLPPTEVFEILVQTKQLPKSEWKAPDFKHGDEHGGGFSHLE
jgi:hypothetical protein